MAPRQFLQAVAVPKRRRRRASGPKLYNTVHYAEPWLHYEVSRPPGVKGLELGFHCESRDKELNLYLLKGFRRHLFEIKSELGFHCESRDRELDLYLLRGFKRHLFEIKSELGENVEAEMWDRGWTKIYEVLRETELTEEYQERMGGRLAEIIVCLHPT